MENILEIQKKAEAGDAKAQYELGRCYQFGHGVPDDIHKCIEWLQKAADNGYYDAIGILANIYEKGFKIEKDLKKTFYYCERAAAVGILLGFKNLAWFYKNGIVVEKDIDKAKELLTKYYIKVQEKAENGDTYAMRHLAWIYKSGIDFIHIPKNFQLEIVWYEKAAEAGDMTAQNLLGTFYSTGYGVPRNHKKALEYYKKSAEQGYANGLWNLAECYREGRGVEQNYELAASYFQKAANKRLPVAQTRLAELYYHGQGVEQDYVLAVFWLKKAAKGRDYRAYYDLSLCYENGYGVEKDLKMAYHLVEIGAKHNNRYCMLAMAKYLIEGKGTNVNFTLAKNNLEKLCNIIERFKENNKYILIEETSSGRYWHTPFDENNKSLYAEAYYLLGKLYYADKGKDGASATKAIAMLRTAEKLGYKDEEMSPKMLIEKIMSETEEAEVKEAANCFVEVRERNGLKGERYEVVLHHADGEEDVVGFKGRNKFLYIMALMTTRKGKEAGGLTTIHFDLMRERLAQLVQDCKVNVNGYKEWIDEFLYDSQIERDENNRRRICMKRTASKYSNASHGANKVIKQWCRTEDEYEIFGLRSTGSRFAMTTIALEPEQIILPEALLDFMEYLPTKEKLENYKVEKVKFVS